MCVWHARVLVCMCVCGIIVWVLSGAWMAMISHWIQQDIWRYPCPRYWQCARMDVICNILYIYIHDDDICLFFPVLSSIWMLLSSEYIRSHSSGCGWIPFCFRLGIDQHILPQSTWVDSILFSTGHRSVYPTPVNVGGFHSAFDWASISISYPSQRGWIPFCPRLGVDQQIWIQDVGVTIRHM